MRRGKIEKNCFTLINELLYPRGEKRISSTPTNRNWLIFLVRNIEYNTGGGHNIWKSPRNKIGKSPTHKGVGDIPILYLFGFWFYFSLNTFVFFFTFYRAFSRKVVFLAKVNCRFIDIRPCLGSIFNVCHNKVFYKYIINTNQITTINTCNIYIWLWSKGGNSFTLVTK